ncbi:MAG: Eco57I restriction-modification methylase domain-containing protein [Bacteroidales bacterium]|jgi:16S rRNA G966 N2-methylase RsmD|nr:Eco57I restriction-modification methylase domain-containing protein [Bacteroidales bacterium]
MLRKNGRRHGEVYTKQNVVEYILDEVGFSPDKNLEKITLLEPASGSGAFALEIINRLYKSSKKYGFNFTDSLNRNIIFVEKDKESSVLLKSNINTALENLGFLNQNQNCVYNLDFLVENNFSKFDCIVGNPPYIRHENLDSEYKLFLKKSYQTFKYRADLYIPFYEKSLDLLNDNGKLSFICSNRWLYNQYGQLLREKVATEYHLVKLINIEKTSPFDEEVIGYPCLTTIAKYKGDKTLYFETNAKKVSLNTLSFTEVESPTSSSWQNMFLDYNINHSSLKSIIDQGFEIGIGIATGADKIFIKKESELNGIERSRVIPVIKSNSLKGESIVWDNSYLLNPYVNGNLCDLSKYPNLEEYFTENKEILKNRHIAKKNPDNWYKTIDKVKSNLLNRPKLLLPDLAGSKYLFIDNGNFYPHHNVYYITNHNSDRLKILASILMSGFIKDQLSKIGIRMNAGLPRFQSQTLKKLRVPDIDSLDTDVKNIFIKAYDNKDLSTINREVDKYCSQKCVVNKAE